MLFSRWTSVEFSFLLSLVKRMFDMLAVIGYRDGSGLVFTKLLYFLHLLFSFHALECFSRQTRDRKILAASRIHGLVGTTSPELRPIEKLRKLVSEWCVNF